MQTKIHWLRGAVLFILLVTTSVLTICASPNGEYNSMDNNNGRTMTIPQGTVIPVTMDNTISSATSHTGETFTVTMNSQENGDNEFPRGTVISGVITGVQRTNNTRPGMLDVRFQQVRFPDGQKMRMNGSLVSLDQKSVTQTSDGRLMARNNKRKNRLKFIAIGTGAGLIIGDMTEHTLLGGILGAAAGYFYAQKRSNKAADVTVRTGTEFGVQFDKAMTFKGNRSFVDARDTYRKSPRSRYASTRGQAIKVAVDGRTVDLENTPAFEDNGIVFIPLTPVLHAVQVPFTYDRQQRIIHVKTDQGELSLKIGKSYATLQGRRETIDAPAIEKNNTVYVTPAFLALAINMHVLWDSNTQTVVISND